MSLYIIKKQLEAKVKFYYTRVNDPTLQHIYYKPHNESKLEEFTKQLVDINEIIHKHKLSNEVQRMKRKINDIEKEKTKLEYLYQEALLQLSE